MSKDEIFETMRGILVETFELEPEAIRPEAKLMEDLDLDSIDAVDLVVKLQQLTDRKIDPETFRSARTVQDVVEAIHALVSEPVAAE